MRARPRGFALPMVIMLVLVAGVMIAVMLERNIAQWLTTQRQYESYTFGHATRGIGEAVDAWIRTNGPNPIADALDPDGRAFDLVTDGGRTLHVYLYDGQGLALADLSGLRTEAHASGMKILSALRAAQGAEAARFTRREGPLAVSVNAAPPEVITAVVDSVLEGQGTKDVVAELLSRRGGSGDRVLDNEGLNRTIADTPVDEDRKARLAALLTASPVLWRVEAESESGATGVRGDRYRAWAVISRVSASTPAADRGMAVQRAVSVFGWEKVLDR